MEITNPNYKPWEQVNWDVPFRNHEIKIKADDEHIYDYETGAVIATISPGYRFYWAHGHIHVIPLGAGPDHGRSLS